jgi:predicted RNase H-like HicB family nuclease
MKFAIAIEAGTRKSAFGVAVPDLPGCFSAGDTIEEAFDNAREAIEAHLEVLAEGGKDLPKTKSLSEWQSDREYKGWTWGIVDVPVDAQWIPGECRAGSDAQIGERRYGQGLRFSYADLRSATALLVNPPVKTYASKPRSTRI